MPRRLPLKQVFEIIGKGGVYQLDAPMNHNEENLNAKKTEAASGQGGQEGASGEPLKKKKNIIRVYHAQNASDGGRNRKKPAEGRRSRTHGAATSAAATQAKAEATARQEAAAAAEAAAKEAEARRIAEEAAAAKAQAEAAAAAAAAAEAAKREEAARKEADAQAARNRQSQPRQGQPRTGERGQDRPRYDQRQGQGAGGGAGRTGGPRPQGERTGVRRDDRDRRTVGGQGTGRPSQGGPGQGRSFDGRPPRTGDGPRREGGPRMGGDGAPRGPRMGDGAGRPPRTGQGGPRPQGGQGGRTGGGFGGGSGAGGRQGGGFGSGRPASGGGARRDGGAFAGETAKPNKDSRRERDRENKNHKKDFDKTTQGQGRRPNQNGSAKGGRGVAAPTKPMPVKKEEKKPEIKEITIPEKLTIRELAESMKVQPSVIVKKLFLKGEMVTVNEEIDFEKAQEIALDFDIIAEKEVQVDVIEELLKEDDEDESKLVPRPPVVCVMGHVDHGKTSLLDYIRNTHVTRGEAGGITQHIGAYVVDVNGQKVTFLDTPGHEAFTAMRMRGANATDIAVLVVAADDGVMPQTIEAISHARAAGVEIIVAINKIDKAGANIDHVKQELSEHQLIPEDWGGNTPCVPVSAHTGEGIDDLLEMIVLTAEVSELKANPDRAARGLVIEAKLDKGKGPVATILIQKGTLHQGDFIAAGSCSGKVRAMMDDKGNRLKEAGPSMPVEILGLGDVPNAGEVLMAFDNDKDAKSFAATFVSENKKHLLEETKGKLSLDNLFSQIQASDLKELPIIVKADVQGSVEAVRESLLKLSNEEVVVKVIHGGVGAINESDVSLAATSNAIIIGFNVRPSTAVTTRAEQAGVEIRLYRVIYDVINEVEAAMKGMLDPEFKEEVLGKAEIRNTFKVPGVGTVGGAYITEGKVLRNAEIRLVRDGIVIHEGKIASLKRFKDDAKEVAQGYECGIGIESYNDIKEGDVLECFQMVEIKRA